MARRGKDTHWNNLARLWLSPLPLLVAFLLLAAGCGNRVGPAVAEVEGIIVDDGDAGFELNGSWTVVEAAGAYGGTCAWAELLPPLQRGQDGSATYGAGTAFAYIRPPLAAAGTYEIYIFVPGRECRPAAGKLATAMEVQVHPTRGFVAYQSAFVDLTRDAGGWQWLGHFYLEQDGSLSLSNLEGAIPGVGTNGAVVADAFRFVYLYPERPTRPAPTPGPPGPVPLPSPTAASPPLPTATPPPLPARGDGAYSAAPTVRPAGASSSRMAASLLSTKKAWGPTQPSKFEVFRLPNFKSLRIAVARVRGGEASPAPPPAA